MVVTWTQGQLRPLRGLFNHFLVTLVPLHVGHTAFEEAGAPPRDTPRHSLLYSDPATIDRIVTWIRALAEGTARATVIEAMD